jgi:hypothetical protein
MQMADYQGMLLTEKGRALLAKAQTGAVLHFTRVKIGDGEIQQGESLEGLNDLVSPKLSLEITHLQAESNGTCHIRTNITNEGLTEGFFVKEVGLFAMDPDLGEEILYAVTTASNPDYIPSDGSATVVNNQFDIHILVGNATNIQADVNPNGLVSQTDFDEHVNKTDDIAHPEAIRVLTPEVPTGNTGKLSEILNWFAYQIKAITGAQNWYDYPAVTLEQLQRDFNRILVQLEVDGRAPGSSGSFLDTLDGSTTRMAKQTASADIAQAVSAGATVLPVDNTTGFVAFTEVTVYDGTNSEDTIVTAVDPTNKTITVQALTNAYTKGAKVARTNAKNDTVAKTLTFGEWGTYSVSVVEVV